VRNEIETKRNETKRNQRKRNETKRNETKRNQRNENEIKRNQRKQNEINENKTKYDARLLPTHISVSFIRRGQDLITIEQEYYAFIQRESVLFT
jgi:Skp family chaperone for outer membrane proteins